MVYANSTRNPGLNTPRGGYATDRRFFFRLKVYRRRLTLRWQTKGSAPRP